MEEPVLTLAAARLQVEPGGQAQLSVTIRNPSHLVESFRLDVVGLDPAWWQVHPPELPVYPGQEETALVVLSPPARAQAPEAALPFGVRAVSTLDSARSVVEEGDLEVGRVLDLQGTIRPVTSRGRWLGKHQVTYTNWGNSAAHLRLSAADKDGELGFRVTPEQVSVPVGGSATARVRVRPRKPFLRGSPAHRPFQILGESGGSAPPAGPRTAAARAGVPEPGRPVLDGALQQLPIVSRSVVMLAGLVALLIIGLIAVLIRTSHVKGATQEDVAPETPTGFTASTPGATLIQLRWNPMDRADSYGVRQVDEANGAILKLNPVAGAVPAFADTVEKPRTRRCYTVVAVRGGASGGESLPSAMRCIVTRDDKLPKPTNVQAEPVGSAGSYKVSWTGSPDNDHLILIGNAPVEPAIPAGAFDRTLAIPAGRHCVSVLATRGTKQASPPSEPDCVVSTGAGATPAPSDPGLGGVAPTPTSPPPTTSLPTSSSPPPTGSTALSGWVAVLGPYAEQRQANHFRDRAQVLGFPARILTLPVAQLPPEWAWVNGMVVVVDQLPSQEDAERVCTAITNGVGTTRQILVTP